MVVQPVIEVYFDPNGTWGGKRGAFRARLRDSHGLHDAADTPEYAVKRLVQNIVCHADYKEEGKLKYAHLPHTPETLEGYKMVRLDPWYFKPVPGDWKARDAAQEADNVDAAQTAASLVSYMFRPRGY